MNFRIAHWKIPKPNRKAEKSTTDKSQFHRVGKSHWKQPARSSSGNNNNKRISYISISINGFNLEWIKESRGKMLKNKNKRGTHGHTLTFTHVFFHSHSTNWLTDWLWVWSYFNVYSLPISPSLISKCATMLRSIRFKRPCWIVSICFVSFCFVWCVRFFSAAPSFSSFVLFFFRAFIHASHRAQVNCMQVEYTDISADIIRVESDGRSVGIYTFVAATATLVLVCFISF